MIYLNENDVRKIGFHWSETIDVISDSIKLMSTEDYNQPIKPYVRFRNKANRIIAMPAFIGGNIALAGIKWIASFPENICNGLPRAHSVTVLNNADTGVPVCIINTSLVSGIRTASVSGYILEKYLETRKEFNSFKIGIVGFGPIGQLHLAMIESILGDRIDKFLIYDIKTPDLADLKLQSTAIIEICNGWEEVYSQADIFVTATVSRSPYIMGSPKKGSLLLNISLRDFKPEILSSLSALVVDSWDEVCRENTDVENMHRLLGLKKEDTVSLRDFGVLNPLKELAEGSVIMFNPMGMAIFDIAIGGFYFRRATQHVIGMVLNS